MRFFFKTILFLVFCLSLFCKEEGNSSTVADVPSSPNKSNVVEIQIKWEYSQIPLRMDIREPSGSQSLTLWATGTVAKGRPAPFSVSIPDSKIFLKPGSKKQFLLVMENPSDKAVHFFAAPHHAHPVEHSFGFKFKCLCVNHAFSIPAGETWYRVVEIRLSPDFLGDKLILTHNLIGITKERVAEFEKAASQSISNDLD
ncbi:LIC11469 family lipoprotein adhesin Lsa20 [Leptospira idonii]|uniref:Lipoprotein n=1 Tax=Leptospira idonii TaxID=1193500 RepID=A0A4V3JY48_9LEPT|nr:hypothetical protein [Leptospira idonii]TGN19986.1 hypothetical protein EHS15_06310 [Leptospira idonii]